MPIPVTVPGTPLTIVDADTVGAEQLVSLITQIVKNGTTGATLNTPGTQIPDPPINPVGLIPLVLSAAEQQSYIRQVAVAMRYWIANGGAPSPRGTSFPGSPLTNDIFFRTDRQVLYFWDGTRWLSVEEHELVLAPWVAGNTTHAATAPTTHLTSVPDAGGGTSIFLTRWVSNIFIGATNDATNHWIPGLAPSSGLNFASYNTGTPVDFPSGWNRTVVTAGLGVRTIAADQHYMQTLTKVAAASSCNFSSGVLHYRLIG